MFRKSILGVLPAIAILVAACSSPSSDAPPAYCASDPRVQTFNVGMEGTGASGAKIAISTAVPSVVQQGLNDWTLTITDSTGTPIEGTVTETALMPDHGHGSPTTPTITSTGNGQYEISEINLSMRGVWQITISIASPTVTDDTTFTFCVDGST